MRPAHLYTHEPKRVSRFLDRCAGHGVFDELLRGIPLYFGPAARVRLTVVEPAGPTARTGSPFSWLQIDVTSPLPALESLKKMWAFYEDLAWPLYDAEPGRDIDGCFNLALTDVPDELVEHATRERVREYERGTGPPSPTRPTDEGRNP